MLAVVVALGGGAAAVSRPAAGESAPPKVEKAVRIALPARFRPVLIPGTDVVLMPESERTLRRVVIGLDPNTTKFFMLPSTEAWDPKSRDPRVMMLRRQLYWLNLELSQGRIFAAAPAHTVFFVAVPDAAVNNSMGNEAEVFADYLRTRVGWSAAEIARRIRTYTVPVAVPFPQDQGELLGRDSRDRLVLGLGRDIESVYLEPARSLGRVFPNDFVLRPMEDINTEGGDLEIVWLPDGKPAVFIGRHRVLRRLERTQGEDLRGHVVPDVLIELARAAYRRAFFGLEAVIVGEAGLRTPALVSDELFHMDMVVNMMRVGERMLAFIPSFVDDPIDAVAETPLAPEMRTRAQSEYDAIASQLAARGYTVVRLPLADHPVRSPVNVAKFISPTGVPTVLLGRYPYHRTLPDGRRPLHEIQEALTTLEVRVCTWRVKPDEAQWRAVETALRLVWKTIDDGIAAPNPIFDMQAGAYRSNGIEVIAVPMLPGGEGGLHCMLLN